MPDLLLELFSEEIPARMQARAAADLEKLVQERLFDAGFMPEGAKAFATPRRLTLVVSGLPLAQPDRREEKKGPRVGAPEKAVEGFLKSAGLNSLEDCETRSDKKGDYYVAIVEEKGRPSAEVMAGFLPEIIRKFPWPKAMRWGDGELRWVRPLHSILCAFDGEIVPFAVDQYESGDETRGHRFLAPEVIRTRNFEEYEIALKRAKVVLDADERKEMIFADSKALCAAQGLELIEDAGLLNELAGLAEWPVAMIGQFGEKFLTVPDEALMAAMKGHQKYFSVRDPKTGRLANRFICVANIEAPDGGAAMREGYERVLTARLSDAWFLYQQDLKIPLADHAAKLGAVTYFEGLGSVGDKVERIAALAREIAPLVGADAGKAEQAARLAKADLVTGMVYEAPELQGLMGRYYALAQGVDAEIADAIRDHYKPAGQGDEVPSAPVTIAVALADKIDTLTGFWAIDEKPTGSKDPFALRRATLGVVQTVLEQSLRIKISFILAAAGHTLPVRVSPEVADDLLSFFHDRLKVYLKDQGHRHDHVDAVRVRAYGSLEDDLVLIVRKLTALEKLVRTEDGENLLAAYKRAANILKAEAKKGDALAGKVDPDKLEAPAEKALHTALCDVGASAATALDSEDFETAMAALASLRAPLDTFFEEVTVNAEDQTLRANRLALLGAIRTTCEQVADLARIEGGG